MPDRDQSARRGSIFRRSASAYLYSPSSVYLTGASIGIIIATTLILLALGGVWMGGA